MTCFSRIANGRSIVKLIHSSLSSVNWYDQAANRDLLCIGFDCSKISAGGLFGGLVILPVQRRNKESLNFNYYANKEA